MCLSFLRVACVATSLYLAASALNARELKVCADPNHLPFSDASGAGFENRIVELVAAELGAKVTYTWFAQRRGFLRHTLNAGMCDLVPGVPSGMRLLRVTKPYYRSSYVFVRRAEQPQITGYDDPAIRELKIGVQLVGDDGVNTPPVHALSKRGMINNVRGYLVYGDYSKTAPLSAIVTAVATGEVDLAVVWGPIAGYFALHQSVPLTLTPILFDSRELALQMTYDIAIGVRKSDAALASEINDAIERRRGEIDAILKAYGVPRTDATARVGAVP